MLLPGSKNELFRGFGRSSQPRRFAVSFKQSRKVGEVVENDWSLAALVGKISSLWSGLKQEAGGDFEEFGDLTVLSPSIEAYGEK